MALIRPITDISTSINLMNPAVTNRILTTGSANATINDVGSYRYAIIGVYSTSDSRNFAIVDIQNGIVLDTTNTVTINQNHDAITIVHSTTNIYHHYYLYS